jgi:hypothetical protein
MSVESASKRRDPRYRLDDGTGTVTFSLDASEEGIHFGALNQIGLRGVGFVMTSGPRMTSGTLISSATLVIGTCEIVSDLVVIQCQRGPDSKIEVGCMLYPTSKESEEKWAALIAGMAAARGG